MTLEFKKPDRLIEMKSPMVLHMKNFCAKNELQIKRLLQAMKRDHESVNELVHLISELFPHETTNPQGKRSLFDAIGRLSHSLFGTATDGMVQAVEKNVLKMADTIKNQNILIKKSVADLTSISRISNERIDNLLQVVKQNTITQIDHLKNETNEFFEGMGLTLEINRKHIEFIHSMNGIRTYYEMFYESLVHLTGGRLPMFLIDCAKLQEVVHEVDRVLRGQNEVTVKWKECSKISRNVKFSYVMIEDHLIITINLPLTMTEPYNVYRLLVVDHKVPQKGNMTMRIVTNVEAIAIQESKNWFFYPTPQEMTEIGLKGEYTGIRRVRRKVSMDICELAVMYDEHEKIKDVCEYHVMVGQRKPEITWIGGNRILVQQAENARVRCAGTPSEELSPCSLCVVTLSNKCEYHTTAMSVSSTWGDKVLSVQAKEQHPVNRALMANFFTARDIATIDGEHLFDTDQKIKLPTWKVDTQMAQELAKDGELKLKLSKIMEAVKKDKDIMEAADTGYLPRNREIDDNEWGWKDYAGSVVIGMVTVLVLTAVAFNVKVQRMAVAIAAMQTEIKRVKGQVWAAGSEKEEEVVEQVVDQIPGKITHEDVSKMIDAHLFYFIVGTMIAACIGFNLYHRIKRCYIRIKNRRAVSKIALQFGSNKRGVAIQIQQVNAMINDISVLCEGMITELEVKGRIFPKLQYRWNAHIKDEYARTKVPLETSVSITYLEAYLLREILKREYLVCLIIKSEGETKRLKVIKYKKKHKVQFGTPQTQERLKRSNSLPMVNFKNPQTMNDEEMEDDYV